MKKIKLKIVNLIINFCHIFLFGLASLYSYSLYAQQGPQAETFGEMIQSLSTVMEQVVDLLSAVATVAGVIFVFMGMFKLKHMADMRNMMQGQADVTKAIGIITVGGFLIWSPYMLEVMTYTLFGSDIASLQSSYSIKAEDDKLLSYYRSFARILQVIGLISFVRGLFVFASMSKGHQQSGTFAKGVTHIIAGVLLFNIIAFAGVVEKTIGRDFSFIDIN